MLEPPGQSRASRAADGGAETGCGSRWPEAVAPEPGPPPRRRPGWGRLPAWAVLMVLAAAATALAMLSALARWLLSLRKAR